MHLEIIQKCVFGDFNYCHFFSPMIQFLGHGSKTKVAQNNLGNHTGVCLGHFKQLSLFLSMAHKFGHLAHAQNVLKHIYFSFGIFEI